MAAQFQSPHPPTGCDVVRPAGSPSRLIPIPAPPTGCDHEESRVIGTEGEFQSPHPYGMRRDQGLPRLRPRPIPIPTSLRDATASFSLPCPTSRFQSPHPYGMRRRQSARRFCDSSTIPIPTSLRDATSGVSCRRSTSDSNPRIPTGCDTPLRAVAGRHASFQSPHPYGMRQHSVPSGYMYADSNPRIPTGCDGCGQRAAQATGRFQSPHPYGMRQSTSTRGYPRNYSNPHIPTGCDRRRPCASTNQRYSNPHIPTGCDRNNYCMNPPRPTTSRTKREPQPSHRTKAAPQLPNHGANLVREACLPRVRAPKRDAPGWSAGRARIFPRSRFTPPASSASVARSTHRRTPRTSTGSSRCSRCASS